MPTHQETNALALDALLHHMQGPNAETSQIQYRQGGRFVLIGNGHTSDNERNVKEYPIRHAGIMMLKILPKNQLQVFIDGNTFQNNVDQGRQASERRVLEGAVQEALDRVNKERGTRWKATFDWAI